jgi:hypothetical protein
MPDPRCYFVTHSARTPRPKPAWLGVRPESVMQARQDCAERVPRMVAMRSSRDNQSLGRPGGAIESRVELLPEFLVLMSLEVVFELLLDLLEWFLRPFRKRNHLKTVLVL